MQQEQPDWGYHNANLTSFGCIWSSQPQPLAKWCYFAPLPCHTPHTLIHLRDTDGKVFSRMANLCTLQTCCTPGQPGTRHWTINLQFLPDHLKEKCLPENHCPAWGMESGHMVSSHAMYATSKLGWRYRHPTSPQAETSWEKKQIKLTHTSLTTLNAFTATAMPYGCGLPPLPPAATALPTV